MNEKPVSDQTRQPDSTYRTGYTEPPKNRRGLFSVLLMAVIFLCGLITILEKMNIHLAETLAAQQEPEMCTVAFEQPEAIHEPPFLPLGFSGQAVPPFWQEFGTLPPGLYITQVNQSCEAAALGILPGDILLTANDQQIPDWEGFLRLMDSKAPGERIQITIYRQGSFYNYSLTMP